ncbi:MAG: hypothetical protein UD936_08565 [Acutalibacteraceae bacterium]|nr:hypothetical protein [Acutalibacteraceae bacterium]
MTIEGFYEEVDGDFSEICSRVSSEERIRKYLNIFSKDKTFTNLCLEINANNTARAFIHAYTLKVLSQNLSLTPLYMKSQQITRALRNNNIKKAVSFLPELGEEYAKVMVAINKLQKDELAEVK